MTNLTIEVDGELILVDPSQLKKRKPSRTLEQWHYELEVYPATRNQCGIIMNEFHRLGFHPERDRDERLDIVSQLIGRDVDSTRELHQGEGGYLVRLLQQCDTADELYDLLPDEPQEQDTPRPTLITIASSLLASLLHK